MNTHISHKFLPYTFRELNHIRDVMVTVLALSVEDRVFEFLSGQTKHYNIGMCCIWGWNKVGHNSSI